MPTATAARRAIGIVRVSQINGREGDSFASPGEQRDRIRSACERDGLRLIAVKDELDVSGGTPLERRAGLRAAVEAVEAGDADVIVGAYFDRLVRSLRVQDELVSRVEAAGGQVLALDTGRVTNGSAGQWLSGTMLGAVAEYARRTAAERSHEAQQRAIDRGVMPWPNVPPGYVKNADGRLEPDARKAPIVAEAVQMRADGRTIKDVRAFLADHGIRRSIHGVSALLSSRVLLGELHFGDYTPNLKAHQPIVARDVWERAQRAKPSTGRAPTEPRLLNRLGVLVCANCGARMVIGHQTQHGRCYPFYRCPSTGDCKARMAISATLVEDAVTAEVQRLLDGIKGEASADNGVAAAAAASELAQQRYDAAVRILDPLEPSAVERLAALRAERDAAREAHEDARANAGAMSVAVTAGDWDVLTLDERRALVQAVIERVEVGPGRGAGRIRITAR